MAEEKKEGNGKDKKERRPSALKRDLQGEKRRLQNKSFKATVNTALRSLQDAISKGDKAIVKEKLSAIYSLMDKGVKTNVFKQNKAGRIKARLTKRATV